MFLKTESNTIVKAKSKSEIPYETNFPLPIALF